MKSFFVAIFILAVHNILSQGFTIKGHLDGLGNSKIYLAVRSATRDGVFDSAIAKNDNFEFKGHVSETDIYKLYVEGNPRAAQFYLCNENIVVTGSLSEINVAEVKGSIENDIRNQWAIERRKIPQDKAFEFDLEFAKKYPDHFVTMEILSIYSGFMNTDTNYLKIAKELLSIIPVDMRNHTIYLSAMAKLNGMNELTVGSKAPAFSQPDINGKIVSLNNFRGKYVFVDFWAHWCSPCRQEHPEYIKIYNTYKNKNFEIVSISMDRERERQLWLDAIAKDGITWTQLSDLKGIKNEAALSFGVDGTLPRSFLINPDGIIVAKDIRSEALKQYLEKNMQ